MSDPIKDMISNSGTLNHPNLYRRWIPIQIFRNCELTDRATFENEFILGKPYWYQWKTLTDEFKYIRHVKDKDEFKTRTRFYNFNVLKSMIADYEQIILQTQLTSQPEYIDTQNNLRRLKTMIQIIETRRLDENNKGYEAVVPTLRVFAEKVWMPKDCHFVKSNAWRNAFYGAGVFYTSQYLIEFQDCCFPSMDKTASLEHLQSLLNANKANFDDLYPNLHTLAQNKTKVDILASLT